MATVTTPTRFFKIGSLKPIEDTNSFLPLEQAINLLIPRFPILRFVKVLPTDGVLQEDGTLLYEVPSLPAKHNG